MSPPFWITLAGSVGVEAGLIFYACRTGFLLLVSIGIFLIPVLILFQTATVWLLNWFRIRPENGFSQDTNSWFYGYPNAAENAAERGKNVNRVLSAQCRALQVPFEPLIEPEVFKQKDRDWEKSQGMCLITDRERRKVYVILRWG
jgi:hypothetical protein